MNIHPFANRRPTPLEDRAYAEARQHFIEHLNQFPASQDAVKNLERNLASTAQAVSTAATKSSPQGDPFQSDDGVQWHRGIDLFDNLRVNYRPTQYAAEFAVMEQFPNGHHEIWNRGYSAVDVLRAFTSEQRQTLQKWSDDLKAQVAEFLAEKYPGEDMSRVADAFVLKCTTESVARKHAITHSHGHKHGGGIHI
jgi:hypothetical protein